MIAKRNFFPGFTLIELVVVIGILAILLSIVLFAINPSRQFAKADNSKRVSDVTAILNAVGHYLVLHNGKLPPEITTSVQHISSTGADLCAELVTQGHISSLPTDPKITTGSIKDCSNPYDTGFTIVKDARNRVTVATDPIYEELSEHISATR